MNGAVDATRLFVGDLASHCDEANIEELFKKHGFDVVNVKLMRGKNSLASLNYGFVQVGRKEDVDRAIAELDSILFLGRHIKVKHATQNQGAKQNRPNVTQSTNSIFVKFRALESGICVTEERLRSLFSSFGDVNDVSIKASNMTGPLRDLESGYGFVHFSGTDDGINMCFKAMDALAGNPVVDGIEYSCEASQNLLRSIHEMKKRQIHIHNAHRSLLVGEGKHGLSPYAGSISQPYRVYEQGGGAQITVKGYANQRVIGHNKSSKDEIWSGLNSTGGPSIPGLLTVTSGQSHLQDIVHGSYQTNSPIGPELQHGSPLTSRKPSEYLQSYVPDRPNGSHLSNRMLTGHSHSYAPNQQHMSSLGSRMPIQYVQSYVADRPHGSPLSSRKSLEHSHPTEHFQESPLTSRVHTIYSNNNPVSELSRNQSNEIICKGSTPTKSDPPHVDCCAIATGYAQSFTTSLKVGPNKFTPNINAAEYTPSHKHSNLIAVSQLHNNGLNSQFQASFPYNASGESLFSQYSDPAMQAPTLTPTQSQYSYSLSHHQSTPGYAERELHEWGSRSMPYYQTSSQNNIQAYAYPDSSQWPYPSDSGSKQRQLQDDKSIPNNFNNHQYLQDSFFTPYTRSQYHNQHTQRGKFDYDSSVAQQTSNSPAGFEPTANTMEIDSTTSNNRSANITSTVSKTLIVGNNVIPTTQKPDDPLAGPETVVLTNTDIENLSTAT